MADYLVHAHIVFMVWADDGEAARQAVLAACRDSDDQCQQIGVGAHDVFIEEVESFIETDKGSAILMED